MRWFRRNTLGALLLFSLIFSAIIGGMAWATVASLKLAETTIREERITKVHRAVGEVEKYIAEVLNTEAARPYTDYKATHTEDPISLRTRDGRELNPDPKDIEVELASPLLPLGRSRDWRPHSWIDVYFQIDSHEKLSSPQFPDDPDHVPFFTEVDSRTQTAWRWLQAIPPGDLLAEARRRNTVDKADVSPGEVKAKDSESDDKVLQDPPVKAPQRPGGILDSQAGYIPLDRCVDPRVIARNILNSSSFMNSDDDDSPLAAGVSMRHTAISPRFWIKPAPEGKRKLVFVREVFADADAVLQGFVGDWERLRADLLPRVANIFPDAELIPVESDWAGTLAPGETGLFPLPVVLRVPENASGTRAEAWRSTRGMLLISWVAAAAVVVVAGWGVRNLVALTERRMQFAYAVTHELRTPLTTFRLYSDMLSAGLVPDEKKQEYLDTLNRESARLSSMVESVMEYARLENRQARLHIRETDAPSLLHSVSETLDKRSAENGIVGRKINEIKNGLSIRTDVELVSQITGVLLNNACRHAKAAKNPTVVLRLAGENGRLYVDVVDSGPGIDLADSRRIFRPFRRGRDADAAARGGIGLGLALARNWATLLGGRLDLINRHDPELGGAHFRLTIPAQASDN